MVWNTERTKQLLLDAGVAEFSAHGLAGARVDRIATAAGVNKERIYQYFGNKKQFFGDVLARELGVAIDAVPITGTGIDAIVDYAGRVFDYLCAHPELARLTFWGGARVLGPRGGGVPAGTVGGQGRPLILAAVPELTREEAEDLLLTVLTLADASQALPNLANLYTGALPGDTARLARRRATITTIVRMWGQPAERSGAVNSASDHVK